MQPTARNAKRRRASMDENAGGAKKAKAYAQQTTDLAARVEVKVEPGVPLDALGRQLPERKPLALLGQAAAPSQIPPPPECILVTDPIQPQRFRPRRGAAARDQPRQVHWKDVPTGFLSKAFRKLGCTDLCNLRLVSKAWLQAAAGSMLTVQRDRAWTSAELVRAATTFPAVAFLDLQDCSNITHGKGLVEMTNLRHLRLNRLKAVCPAGEWSFVSKLTQLETLVLNKCEAITRINLSGFSKLQRLDLNTCFKLSSIGTRTLLPRLTSLSLRECRSLGTWKFLGIMPALRALDVAYCPLFGPAAAAELAACQQLETLVVQHCSGFDDAGLRTLLKLRGLRILYADGCWRLTERAIEAARIADRGAGIPRLNVIKFSI